MAELTSWRPLHDAHAIERALIGVTFSQEMTDLPLKRAINAAREAIAKFGAGLFVENPVQEVQLNFHPATGASRGAVPRESGMEFVRHQRPNEPGEIFAIDRNSIRFETRHYTRWSPLMDRAMPAIAATLPIYMATVPLLGVSLEYYDRFDAVDAVAARAGEVIARGRYVSNAAFSDEEQWHCRTGWYENSPQPKARRLTNVDVNVADAQLAPDTINRVIVIRTFMRETYNLPGSEPLLEDEVTPQVLASTLENLHISLKSVLREVITEAAADRIALAG